MPATTIDRLKAQISMVRSWMEGTVSDCDDDLANRVHEGATIGSIAAIYAHVLYSEDRWVNAVIGGGAKVYDEGGWQGRLGVDLAPIEYGQTKEWSQSTRLEMATLRAYAAEVHAATDKFLASVQETDLETTFDTGFAGQQSALWILDVTVITHYPTHMGEIGALKGVSGLKGLPM